MLKAFYYDVVCPYAYMAFTYLKRFDAFTKNDIHLKPILLGGLFKHLESESDPNKRMSSIKSQYFKTDIKRQSEFFDVKLEFHPRHPVSTVKAMRLLVVFGQAEREAMTERLYRAYWQENLDIDDDEVISGLATECGINAHEAFGEQAKQQLTHETKEAFERGVFGVPTMAINDRLYFGGDRLVLIEKELGIPWPDCAWQPSASPIDFYFDFSSPYSSLAWAEVKHAQSLGVVFNLRPVLLGAIFKEIGTANIPLLSGHPHKVSYLMQDMKDWAAYRNFSFKFNTHFPLRSVTPLRVALIEPRTIDTIFHAAWVDDVNISEPALLQAVLEQAGFPASELLKRAEEETVKNWLKVNTSEGLARGVFGVPTFFVNGQQVYGQDRFSWIRKQVEGRR